MKELDDLHSISEELYKTEMKIQKLLPIVNKLTIKYESMYHNFLLHSGMASAPQREAEAKEKLALEPINEEYLESKMELRLAYSMKDTLTTISSNMRSMAWTD